MGNMPAFIDEEEEEYEPPQPRSSTDPADLDFENMSIGEQSATKGLMNIDLEEAERELSKRTVVQHMDKRNGTPVFNAFYRHVAIHDEDGNLRKIDNHAEIRKMKRQNAGKDSIENAHLSINGKPVAGSGFDPDIDDDVEFDF